jgi:hypothetical protein
MSEREKAAMTDAPPIKTATEAELRQAVLHHSAAFRKGDLLTLIYNGNIYVCDYEWAQKVIDGAAHD